MSGNTSDEKRRYIISQENKLNNKDYFTIMDILNDNNKLTSAKKCGNDSVIILDLLSDEIIDQIYNAIINDK